MLAQGLTLPGGGVLAFIHVLFAVGVLTMLAAILLMALELLRGLNAPPPPAEREASAVRGADGRPRTRA